MIKPYKSQGYFHAFYRSQNLSVLKKKKEKEEYIKCKRLIKSFLKHPLWYSAYSLLVYQYFSANE